MVQYTKLESKSYPGSRGKPSFFFFFLAGRDRVGGIEQGLAHARQVLYHQATAPALDLF
jgi:hypothetical protein